MYIMLVLKDRLLKKAILSLRTGGQIAQTEEVIINPDNLKVEGFYCSDSFSNNAKILLNQDIRELIPKGIVVNDYEVLAEPEDLIRLEKILEIGFELIGKPVYTNKRKKIGKVSDYALDSTSLYVQKLYVAQSILRKLGGNLSVDRGQVIEVTDKKIIISDPQKPVKASDRARQPVPVG